MPTQPSTKDIFRGIMVLFDIFEREDIEEFEKEIDKFIKEE